MYAAQASEFGANVAIDGATRRAMLPIVRAGAIRPAPIGAGVSAGVVRNGSLRTRACPCAPSTTTVAAPDTAGEAQSAHSAPMNTRNQPTPTHSHQC